MNRAARRLCAALAVLAAGGCAANSMRVACVEGASPADLDAFARNKV
jgi:hypothetical protein